MKATARITLITVSLIIAFLGIFSFEVLGAQTRDERLSSEISFLNVTDFAQDQYGYMWISTLGGLNRYNGYEFELFSYNAQDTLSLANDFVFSLELDLKGNLWAGTAEQLCLFDPSSNTFKRFKGAITIMDIFEDSRGTLWVATNFGPGVVDMASQSVVMKDISCIADLVWEDSEGRIWLGLNEDRGMACLKEDGSVAYYPLPDGRHVKSIYKSPNGEWWLGTDRGLVVFSPLSYTFRMGYDILPQNSEIYNGAINFIIEDSPMSLLLGTNMHGLFRLDLISALSSRERLSWQKSVTSFEISCCYVDSQDDVWIGTFDKGFFLLNTQKDDFNRDFNLDEQVRGQFVSRVTEDKADNLWITTRRGDILRYSPSSGETFRIPRERFGIESGDCLEELYADSSGDLWLASESSLSHISLDGKGNVIKSHNMQFEGVRSIEEDKDGNMWIGSQTALYCSGDTKYDFRKICDGTIPDIAISPSGEIYYASYARGIYRINEDRSTDIVVFPDRFSNVSGRAITICFDSKGRLWIGSYGFGLLCKDGEKLMSIGRETELPSNNVLCFVEDLSGDMWASTSKGIVRIRETGGELTCQSYFTDSKVLGNQFHEKSGFLSSSGKVMFGGNHGMTFFNPSDVSRSNYRPRVIIEDLKIFNRSVLPGEEGMPLDRDIRETSGIVLSHKSTSISLDYSAIDFHSSRGLTYKYILEGFDKEWIDAGNFRRATYSNLPAGEYVFKVVAVNGEGEESVTPTSLDIKVKPSPWRTDMAYILYIILSVSLLLLVFKTIYRLKINRTQLEIERKEKEREREMDEMKTTFFTNISHELRTPLTLIYAPLQKLVSDKSLSDSQAGLVSTIDRNTQKILQLISQLLDFSKVENGVLRLMVSYADILAAVRERTESFLYAADMRRIKVEFACTMSHFNMWFDRDKIDKILNNLLSNALKHTPEGGHVRVELKLASAPNLSGRYAKDNIGSAGNFVEISVIDNGTGIPEDKLGELFVRYRSIDGNRPDYSSNGIGLHYTRTLVEKHHGEISAVNNPDGGMDFSFILPVDDVFSEDEKAVPVSEVENNDGIKPEIKTSSQGNGETIIVAEDNDELRAFLVGMLSEDYKVLPARDGLEAMSIIESESVDLVLSDVIMPKMDGYALCSAIKSKSSVNHVPVVILTAKTTVANQIEGLDSGADAYVCKPFNPEYLRHVISSQLANRLLLRNYFILPNVADKSIKTVASQHQKAFLDKVTSLIEKEISNPDLNIDQIITELGYSRSVFYRKIKGLTGFAPNDFLREYRFKRAAEMILRGENSLVTISEHTGFSSYSYFSKAFKLHFGVSPKDYGKHADAR